MVFRWIMSGYYHENRLSHEEFSWFVIRNRESFWILDFGFPPTHPIGNGDGDEDRPAAYSIDSSHLRCDRSVRASGWLAALSSSLSMYKLEI
jgi:hypothetical protein